MQREINIAASYLQENATYKPRIMIVCGSGLGSLADEMTDCQVFKYEDIPSFPVSTVEGHAGELIFGKLEGVEVVCMKGRFHLYEGYSIEKATMPIRVMAMLGVELLLVTNAAGGINQDWNICDLMILKDHINMPGLSGNHPLVGANKPEFGPRFPPMSGAYDEELIAIAQKKADELGFSDFIRQGTYACVSGPSYETPHEILLLANAKADAVGMSTAPEVIVARHCGIKCLGISMVTNIVVLPDAVNPQHANHEEVLEAAVKRTPDVQKWVKSIVVDMNKVEADPAHKHPAPVAVEEKCKCKKCPVVKFMKEHKNCIMFAANAAMFGYLLFSKRK
eukprot:TRINITY_DN774100_c0_g1_i1.p1 TRINITY_DN774100_c0_g1~~TRINITY_DN774100_c0_g1_i1.p1  ORF type:complete len:349 (+),score=88.18 TRINITY_DN774100_c0_g1_i1:41-1048(+)